VSRNIILDQLFKKPKFKILQLSPWILCPLCNGGIKPGWEGTENAWPIMEVIIVVDERGTYAIPPVGSVPFAFQEYRYYQCNNKNCRHTWGHHPTGKWYSERLSEEMMARIGIFAHILRKFDEKIKYYNQVDHFSNDPPVRGLNDQKVILFTGAGLSMALNYPSVRTCIGELPETITENLKEWFDKAPMEKQKAVTSDLEILIDELFYLQKLAFRYDVPEFYNKNESLKQQEIDFYFN